MPVFHDQLGNQLTLNTAPQRIISLVPSQSEFLWDLGIRPVGITKFCIHPDQMFRSTDRVGGTKTIDLQKIRQLQPDLIIGNREENELAQIKELQQEFPVYMSDIVTLNDSTQMMQELAEITGYKIQSEQLMSRILSSINSSENRLKPWSVLYLMWNEPYMAAASGTFINSIITHAGLTNAVGHLHRYPQLNDEEIKKLNPELCFLSSEPFPFNEKHVDHLKKILPHAKIILVDGEMFSWYGSRLAKLSEYLKHLKVTLNER